VKVAPFNIIHLNFSMTNINPHDSVFASAHRNEVPALPTGQLASMEGSMEDVVSEVPDPTLHTMEAKKTRKTEATHLQQVLPIHFLQGRESNSKVMMCMGARQCSSISQ
jgi:hypothetical protein